MVCGYEGVYGGAGVGGGVGVVGGGGWWFFFFQAEDGIRDYKVTGVQTCALPDLHSPNSVSCRVSLASAKNRH